MARTVGQVGSFQSFASAIGYLITATVLIFLLAQLYLAHSYEAAIVLLQAL
jgi:hypothetical protein